MSSKKSCKLGYYFSIFWKILCSTTFTQCFIIRVYNRGPFAPPGKCQKKPGCLGLVRIVLSTISSDLKLHKASPGFIRKGFNSQNVYSGIQFNNKQNK